MLKYDQQQRGKNPDMIYPELRDGIFFNCLYHI